MSRRRVIELCDQLARLTRERGQHDLTALAEALREYAGASTEAGVTLAEADLRRVEARPEVTMTQMPTRTDSGATFVDSISSLPRGDLATASQVESDDPDVSLTDSGTARYIVLREIARGGMGRIVEAVDRDLRRTVAMKLVPQSSMNRRSVEQFLQEAQITAQLEHPGVVPVYDLGRLRVDGEPHLYYTMKRVPGRPLSASIRALHAEPDEAVFDAELRRLVRTVAAVCQVLDYAHARDVLHLDLKPANIMIGDFGEVYLVDWGIAEVREVDDAGLRTVLTEAGLGTRAGRVSGTPQFMAPELLEGEVSVRCDVYGMGAVLYSVLCGQPPFPGMAPLVVLASAAQGELVPPSEARPDLELPARLVELCVHALAPKPAERVASMRELHERLVDWLDGYEHRQRRTGEAVELTERGVELVASHLALASRLKLAGAVDTDALLDGQTWDRDRLRSEARSLFVAAERALCGALEVSENEVARRSLSDLYADRTRNAALLGVGVAEAAYLAQQGADGSSSSLVGGGTLRIRTPVPGVMLELRALDSNEVRVLGGSPQVALDVPRGDYMLVGRLAGYEPIQWAFTLAPDQDLDVRLPLLAPLSAPLDVVAITMAAGPDQPASAGFFATREAIGAEAYLEFLNALAPGESARRVPRTPAGDPLWVWVGTGWRTPRGADALGVHWRPRVPVVAISRDDARAFCAWNTERTGRAWRLPSDQEWEFMVRGALEWSFPWGREPRRWRGRRFGPSVPGETAHDRSVLGLTDAVGNVAQWVESEGWPVARGGSWLDEAEQRTVAARRVVPPGSISPGVGFRCVID